MRLHRLQQITHVHEESVQDQDKNQDTKTVESLPGAEEPRDGSGGDNSLMPPPRSPPQIREIKIHIQARINHHAMWRDTAFWTGPISS